MKIGCGKIEKTGCLYQKCSEDNYLCRDCQNEQGKSLANKSGGSSDTRKGCGRIFRINNELCSPANLCPDCHFKDQDFIDKIKQGCGKNAPYIMPGNLVKCTKGKLCLECLDKIDAIKYGTASQPDAFLGGYATYTDSSQTKPFVASMRNSTGGSSHTEMESEKTGDTFLTHNDRDGRPKGKGRVVTNPTANLAGTKESSPTLSAEDRLQTTNEGKAHPQDTFSARIIEEVWEEYEVDKCINTFDYFKLGKAFQAVQKKALTAVLDEMEKLESAYESIGLYQWRLLEQEIQKWSEACK